MKEKIVRIFNKKLQKEITIESSLPQVAFTPKEWDEENPHVLIKLDGLHFSRHADFCEDCKAFRNSFGTNTTDWQIEYLGKTLRLNLKTLGQKTSDNHLEWRAEDYFCGSILKLNIDTDTIESLQEELTIQEKLENYEGCSLIFEKIKAISE